MIHHLTKDSFRPARVAISGTSSFKAQAREQRARSRSASLDPLGLDEHTWPQDWAVNRAAVRTAVRAFQAATDQVRRRFEPPSTGGTPEGGHTPDRSGKPSEQRLEPSSPSRSSSNPHSSTSQTSADESVHRSVEHSNMASGSGEPIDIEAIISNAIARYVRDNPPQRGPPGDPGPPGQDAAATAARSDTPRFVASDVGFFDPFYDGKSSETASGMEHAGKDTYFRDVTVFIDRLKDVARVKGADLLRTNLQICLRGEALEWYTSQLTDNEKRLFTYGSNVDEWSTALLERFGPTKASGMAIIVKERYSLNDAARRREPREYAMTIIRAAKIAKLGDVHNQLDVIWNGLDVEFQSDIDAPTEATTLNQFLASMDVRKQQWWTKASRMGKHNNSGTQHTAQHATQRATNLSQNRNSSQYNQARSMPFRPMNSGFQNSGFQNMNRQQAASPYQNSQAYNSYQNRQQPGYSSSGPAYPRRDQQALSTPATQRQITAGPSQNQHQNAYASRPPFQAGSTYQAGNGNTHQPKGAPQYRSGSAYQPARPAYQQRAYQASIDESEMPEQEAHQDTYSEEPNSFHNSYHQDLEYGSDLDGYSSFDSHEGSVDPEVNFIDAVRATLMHECQRCKQTFQSRNKLFSHLRNQCWTESDEPVAIHATEPSAPKIIESIVSAAPERSSGTAFRGFQHTKADARFTRDSTTNTEVCLDPGCPITLGDRALLRASVPNFEQRIRTQPSPIPVRGYGNKITNATEYIVMDCYFPGTLDKDGAACIAKVPMEVHLTDDLKANMLIGTDVLTPHKFSLDCAAQIAIIGSCQNIKIAARSVAKPYSQVRRVVKAKSAITLEPNSITNVPVSYHGTLPDDRDFLFEPELPINLGYQGGVFAHVVDTAMTFVQAKNATSAPVVLPRHVRLGTVVEYEANGCYQVSYKSASLAACGWRTSDRSQVSALATTAPATTKVDRNLEHVLSNGVTIYGRSEEALRVLSAVVSDYEDVFTDTGGTIDIPEDQWMPIPLKPDAKVKSAKVYPLGQKDREVVDATFDKLQQQGKLRFSTQPTPYGWPCFVVWRDTPQGRKGRVVIDIRGLNAIAEDDGYPLPLQSDIIGLIAGYMWISTVDGVAWFHQFNAQRSDRSKLTIISHRGQEESSVALMGYKGSPPYVQRQTDALLRPLRAFVRAFVDDIIIFSRSLAEHESHLRQLFQLLRERRASLAPGKSFIGFPSVTLLGQKVDSLGMSTSEEKIKAITSLRFPSSLRDLEIFLGLTGWLRNSIPRYAQRAQPLQERKTSLTQAMTTEASRRADTATTSSTSVAPKASTTTTAAVTKRQLTGPARKRSSMQLRYDPSQEEIAAFQDLQDAFRAPTFLAHFDRRRQLYVDIDASKTWGFAAMVYHTKVDRKASNEPPAKKDVQAIMFLSKSINTAERNYWPTELEVAAIVWVVRKIRHMIEASEVPPAIIYTDHSAAVQISRQTTLTTSSTDKLNLRLVRASQYLSGFNLSVRHKAGKTNVVPDALSRLQADVAPEEGQAVLEGLYGSTVLIKITPPLEPTPIYHMTLVQMSDDFKKRLVEAYTKDPHWNKILDLLKPSKDGGTDLPEGLRFRKHNELIYSITLDHAGRQRLCIPESMQREVFELAHDKNFHAGFHTTYARIAPSVYIRGLTKHLQTYLKHCPSCQLNQTKRHPTYGELNPIATPAIPFHTLTMDFIVALPYYEGRNTLLTTTCKFTKKKLLIPGFDEWTAVDWANAFIVALMEHDWGIPVVLISDRDSKFMSAFWQAVFERLGVDLAASTAWHPQTDGQSERTNQTVEIALRFHLTTGTDDWLSILPFLQACLNKSVTSATGFAPNELAYGFRVRDTLGMLADLPAEDLNKLRLIKREEADDAIAFANAMAKTRYDSSHKAINLGEGSLAYLRLHHGYSIPGVNPKLSNQRVGPFKVLSKVGNLAYKLELPEIMKIHPVISIAQLEPALDQAEDPYSRTPVQPPPPVEEDLNESLDPTYTAKFPLYEVERLLDRQGTGSNVKYLVKWKGYGNHHNAWYPPRALPQQLMDECDARVDANPTRQRRQTPASKAQSSQPLATPIIPTITKQAPRRRGRPRKAQQAIEAAPTLKKAAPQPSQLRLTQ